MLSTLLLSACDSFTPDDTLRISAEAAHLQAARNWFDDQTAVLSKDGDVDALRQFYPDWDKGVVVTVPGGNQAVVTTLWRDYTITYDSSRYFLHTLAVLLDDNGDVADGHIVEFSSPDSIAYTDGPALVRQ